MMKKILSIVLGLLLFAAPAFATCSLWSGNTYTCLSSDTKPAATNGSRLYETDTRKEFLRASGAWEIVTNPANQVTGGDSHDHTNGAGAQLDHTTFTNVGTYSHASIDTRIPLVDWLDQADTDRFCSGVVDGGTITPTSGNLFNIAAGHGYINDHAGTKSYVSWGAKTGVSTVGDGSNYVAIHADGSADVSLTKEDTHTHVYLGHLYAASGNTVILETWNVPEWTGDYQKRINDWMSKAVGVLVSNGTTVSEKTTPNFLELNIAAGEMYARLGTYTLGTTSNFASMYHTSDYDWVPDTSTPNHVNTTQYNNYSGTYGGTALVTMTDTYWKKDLLLRTTSGNVYYVMAQAQYATEDLAKNAMMPALPPQVVEDSALIATVVSQKGDTTIATEIYDVRPNMDRIFGYGTGSGGASTDHSTLTNLNFADSGHYGLLDGDWLPALSVTKKGGVPATGTPSGKYLRDDATWQTISAGGAPTTSKYLLQQADGSLPNAQSMGALGTGLVKNTTTTGVQSIAASGTDYGPPTSGNGTGLIISTTGTGAHTAYGGTSCTNQFTRSLNASGAATCAGIGVADFTANQGTTAQVLHGNAAGQPSWSSIIVSDLPTVTVAKGGSNLTTVAADQVYVGTAADTFTAKTLPACAVGATSKLLYDTTTHAFSCGTDQTGGTPSGVMTMISIKDYGAVGDGSTDDLAHINSAQAAACAGHGGRGVDLYFPEGVYAVSGTLVNNCSNVRWIGAGVGSTVIYPTFTTGDVVQIGDGTNSRAMMGFMHMQIFAPSAHTSGVGINVQYASDVWIDDFSMNNMFIGVQVGTPTNPSLKVHITNGTIDATYATTGVGIYVLNGLGGDTYIDNIVTSNNPASKPAAGIRITQSGHTSIIRCNITGSTIGLDVNPGASQDVNYLFIDHSLFDSGGTHGAKFAPTNATGRIRSVMSVNSWYSGSLVNYGIEIGGVASSTVDALSFIGCRILNNYQHGVYISYAGATNISFTDCTIAGNGQQTINTYNGIEAVANVSGVSILNTKIGTAGTATNQQKWAINIAAGTSGNWQVIGNDCQPNGTVGTRGYINHGALTGYGNQFVLNNPQLSPGMETATTAASAAINTTNTIISSPLRIKANSLAIGTVIRITAIGTCTSTAANISTFRMYFGPNGTTADTLILTTATSAAATSGTTVPFKAIWNLTVRTIGSGTSATVYGTMELQNHNITGIISAAQGNIVLGTAAGFNSTADGILSLAYQSAATTTTTTFQEVYTEIVKP